VAVCVTLLFMAVSAVAALGWRSQLAGEGRDEFDVDATEARQLVNQQLQSARDVLEATRADVGEGRVTAERFGDTVAEALPETLSSLATVTMVEQVPEGRVASLEAERRAEGLPDFQVRDVDEGGSPPAIATFEASNRGGAAILSGYDLRAVPALAQALRPDLSRMVRVTPLLDPLPADVLEVHPDLGRSGFAMVAPAGRGSWVVAMMSGDELAAQAAAVDPELDVALAIQDELIGTTAAPGGASVDLAAVDGDARHERPIALEGGPIIVTVADVDGLAGTGWREPGMLLGAGMALSVLVGSLVLVLARGRAGALQVASEARRARDRSEQNFRAVVQHLSDLVVVTDDTLEVTYVTPSVLALLGRDAQSLPGRQLSDLVHPDDRPLLASLSTRAGVSEKGLVRLRHSDGSDRSFEVVVANRLEDPAVHGLVVTGHDVTDRVQLEDRLAHDATHDALTALPNRALIRDRLEHALVRADRTGRRVAVVFGDLDAFKSVNDRYGHLVGDQLLAEVARRLRGAARAMDTVGRWAGDEFVVICEDLDDEDGARLVAERLHGEVVRPFALGGVDLDVSMSLGVALAEPGEGAESVLDRADHAMYQAKADRHITFAA
ncbi:MAG TPA: diguanylate cyclase, partial [Acidimicrobiales bacterium]|nr:diguanylate cyclase [Acidimicrobiales bacterium]